MKEISIIGVDLAKNVFQVHAMDKEGNGLFNRCYRRGQFEAFLHQLPPCRVGMEACASAHHWGRTCQSLGHEVKLVNPRQVKAYVQRNKTDAKDAQAIAEASARPQVHTIPVKGLTQQASTSLARARSQLVRRRVQLTNHVRSQLSEYGIVTARGHASLRRQLVSVLDGQGGIVELGSMRFVLTDLYEEWCSLEERVKAYDQQMKWAASHDPQGQRMMEVPGIGAVTAMALVAKVDDFRRFKRGSDFAAWLGLTPKEYSSGGKRTLGRISKQGDRTIRTLLIHGARASLRLLMKQASPQSHYGRWALQLMKRVGMNKAAVALANKHARLLWAMMVHGRSFDPDFGCQWSEG